MSEFIVGLFSNLPRELATFLIAFVPVTELRASIPIAVKVYGLSPLAAWAYSVAGTYFVMVAIVLLLGPIEEFISKYIPVSKNFFIWLFEHTRKSTNKKMKKYGEWSIFILAAIPVPFLGGLIGALAAFVFNVPLKKSLPLLLIGTMVSGAIVLGITLYL